MTTNPGSAHHSTSDRCDRYGTTPDTIIPMAQWQPFYSESEYASLCGYITRQGSGVLRWCRLQIERYAALYTNWPDPDHEIAAWVDLVSWQQEHRMSGMVREDREREVFLTCLDYDQASAFFSSLDHAATPSTTVEASP